MIKTSFLLKQARSKPDIPCPPVESGRTPRSAHSLRSALKPRFFESAAAVGDVLTIIISGFASALLYKFATTGMSLRGFGIAGISAILSTNFALLNIARRNYRLKQLLLTPLQVREVLITWSMACGLLAVAGFTLKISNEYSRGASLLFVVVGLGALLSWRLALAHMVSRAFAKDAFSKTKIIVISQTSSALSSRSLIELKKHGYEPVATCCLTELEVCSSGASSSLRAKVAGLIELARAERVEGFYVLIDWNYLRSIEVILNLLSTLPLPVYLLPDENASRFLRCPTIDVGNTWTFAVKRPPLSQTELFAKRIFDLTGSLAGLALLAPLMLITAALVKLDSPGPIFFHQRRKGFNGHPFSILKFRTMHVLEDGPDVKQATANDRRVTRLGRWLRRTSIDELPQLINVVKGEMSLVGPRPHAHSHDTKYEKEIAKYAFRHHVKPGLTGWAQVNGYRGETTHIELMERRIEYDLWYINNWSFKLDLWVTLKTAAVVMFQRAAY